MNEVGSAWPAALLPQSLAQLPLLLVATPISTTFEIDSRTGPDVCLDSASQDKVAELPGVGLGERSGLQLPLLLVTMATLGCQRPGKWCGLDPLVCLSPMSGESPPTK